MSENPAEFIVPADPASAFSAMLDFLAPEADDAEAGTGAAPDGAAGAVAGQQPAPAEGAGAAAPAAGAPVAGDGGKPAVPPAGGVAPTAVPAAGVAADTSGSAVESAEGVDATTILPKFGEMSVAFETRQSELLEQQTFAALQTERPDLFSMLNTHPRMLIGKELPSPSGQGTERIKDAADAESFKDAWKSILLDEVASRVDKQKDDLRDVFATVHSSISLFQENPDLIPGTKQFDKELADAFVGAAKDYELKTNGKLLGYSVPVQPIINAIRSQLGARRAAPAATAPPAAVLTPQQQRAAEQARTEAGRFDGPQAGILSQAGQSGAEGSDDASGVLAAFYRQNGVVI